jgi:hypothetical protein
MPKRALSVTLDADNLLWLRGQARATKARGLSETLDRIVTEVRSRGLVHEQSVRSVVGTVDINPDDPGLERADAHVRALFDQSLGRPLFPARPAASARRRRGASRRG